MDKHLTEPQRGLLEGALRTKEAALRRLVVERREGVSRTEHARQELQQDPRGLEQRDGEFEVEAALAALSQRELGAVQAALSRVHSPNYGVCAACGALIPFERLMVEPEALECVACARTKLNSSSA